MMRFGRSLVLRRTRIIGLPVFLCRSIRRQVLSCFFFLYFGRKYAWMPSRFVFQKKELALSFWLLACWGFYWAGGGNGCHKMQMSRWWRSSSYIWEWFGKSMQKFLIDMSWAFFLRFLVYGYIVCVLVFISKWQGKATLICLSAYLRLYVVLLLSVVCARHRKK